MNIAIIDYHAGNVQSVLFALERIGASAILTNDIQKIKLADKVIFPGVGEAKNTMAYLQKTGLADTIYNLKQPTLGICLGMQLLCQHSEEGNTDCLNIIPIKVKKFVAKEADQKVPHIGWNKIIFKKNTPLLQKNKSGDYAYFVHSYYVESGEYTTATCNYIQPFSAALQKDNFYATQFHPEKSGDVGELILKEFIKL